MTEKMYSLEFQHSISLSQLHSPDELKPHDSIEYVADDVHSLYTNVVQRDMERTHERAIL